LERNGSDERQRQRYRQGFSGRELRFLGFNKLEKVAYVGENLLTRLRDGQLTLNPELTTALLGMVDAVRQMLKEIQSTGQDGDYALRNTSELYKRKYFSTVDEKKLQVRPEVKKLVTFSRLNLQDDSKMLFMKGMDLIFCCNVLIYFDGASKSKVINHFFSNLNFGGYFFLGTSESLMNLNDKFHLVHFPGTIAYWKPSLSSGKL
jgi:hypothetical protein